MSVRTKVGLLVASLLLGVVAYVIHARRASAEADAAVDEFRQVHDALAQGEHGTIYDQAAASFRAAVSRDRLSAALARFEAAHGRPKGYGLTLTAGAILRDEAVVTGPRRAFTLDFAAATAVPVDIRLEREDDGYKLAYLAIRMPGDPLELPVEKP